jgi:hypothetical protein
MTSMADEGEAAVGAHATALSLCLWNAASGAIAMATKRNLATTRC